MTDDHPWYFRFFFPGSWNPFISLHQQIFDEQAALWAWEMQKFVNRELHPVMDRFLTLLYMQRRLLKYERVPRIVAKLNHRLERKQKSKKFRQILKNRQLKYPTMKLPTAQYRVRSPSKLFIYEHLELHVVRHIAEFVA